MATMLGRRIVKGWGPLLGIPALFALAAFMGEHPRLLDLPLCGARLFIGVPCPGCGLTHAFASLTRGDVMASISYNPMGIVIALWLLYVFCRAVYYLICGRYPRPLLSDGTRFFVLNVFLVALLGQWIAGLVIKYFGFHLVILSGA